MKWLPWIALAGCTAEPVALDRGDAPTDPTTDTGPAEPGEVPGVTFVDRASEIGLLDDWDDTFERGRMCLPADFDRDGWLDVMVGNPGDTSRILRGGPIFEPAQVLSEGNVFWSGAVGDLDNDGLPDLFVGGGGNETAEADRVYRNATRPGGPITLESVQRLTLSLPGGGRTEEMSTAGVQLADFDGDGFLDAYGSTFLLDPTILPHVTPDDLDGLNPLWLNQGDGTFVDVGFTVGLHTQFGTQHSAALDYDRDGDVDLFENNKIGPSVLWRNRLVEDGALSFENVTTEASLAGSLLSHPVENSAFSSLAADLNDDGWDDLLVFRRKPKNPDEPERHSSGHLLFLNVGGVGFVEVGALAGLDEASMFRDHLTANGTMGSQAGDYDADGRLDVVVGNGGPSTGTANLLYHNEGNQPVEIAGLGTLQVPRLVNVSALLDFPSPDAGDVPFPYRTHAICFGDFDRDGFDEIFEMEGGPAGGIDALMREPDRLFDPVFTGPVPRFLRVRLEATDGAINRDAIGARVAVTVEQADGTVRTLHRTRRGGSGFSADNGPELFFGLGDAVAITDVEVTWPDGRVDRPEVPDLDAVVTWTR